MFLKVIFKTKKSTGERIKNYRLCESYRYDNTVRHHTILHLGSLEDLPDIDQKKALTLRINDLVRQSHTGEQDLFKPQDKVVEKLAQKYFAEIKEKERLDIAAGKDYHRIDTNTVENKNIREAGTEWLCLQALEQLNISAFLRKEDWKEEQIQLALTHIISRAAYPASELRTSEWIKQNSSVCELTGYPIEKITKDKLYEISKSLYKVKENLEKHLSKRTNELFDLDDKIILYDLTNTYFEGSMRRSKIAQFGKSKEKRNDARLVVLAVVINTEGFLKYSQIFEGNTSDCTTLEKIITELCARTSSTERHPIVVLDAGIATEDNLKLLKKNKFDYMCVSRSGMSKYSVDISSSPIKILDKKEQPITLQKVTVANNKGIITNITWKQKPLDKKEGYYLLRTTLTEKDEQVQWTIYNIIREIEATFRTLKTDLDLRPIFHKKDEPSMAHLHLGLLAYWVVNTIRYQLKQKGIKNEWRDIVRIMNTQKIVTTTMDNEYDQQIIIRQCSEPTEDATKIYTALKYKSKPFTRKKSVVPLPEFKKNQTCEKPQFFSG